MGMARQVSLAINGLNVMDQHLSEDLTYVASDPGYVIAWVQPSNISTEDWIQSSIIKILNLAGHSAKAHRDGSLMIIDRTKQKSVVPMVLAPNLSITTDSMESITEGIAEAEKYWGEGNGPISYFAFANIGFVAINAVGYRGDKTFQAWILFQYLCFLDIQNIIPKPHNASISYTAEGKPYEISL